MATMRIPTGVLASVAILTGVLVLSACGSTSSGGSDAASPGAAPDLGGTSWNLESYAGADGQTVAADTSGELATLTFATDGSFSGSTGCNRITGTYTQDGSSLTIASGPMTLRACLGDAAAAQEAAIMAALPLVTSFEADSSLVLLDASGSTLLTYAPGLSSLADTSWQATGINNGKEAVVSQEGTDKVTAVFGGDGTLSGSGGCNTYSGTYETAEPDGITIGAIAATEMACEAPAMEIEQQYFTALANVATYTLEGNTLTLRDAAGAIQVSFVQAP